MKNKSFLFKILTLALLLLLGGYAKAQTLYSEDFSNDGTAGWDGATANSSVPDGNWYLTSTGTGLDTTGGSDYVKVVSGELHWRDMSASSSDRVQWVSKKITGCATSVAISMDWSTQSSWTYQRRLRFYYKIDNGAYTLFSDANYSSSGTYSGIASINSLSFNDSIRIMVDGFISTSDADGTLELDNILVTGTSCCSISNLTAGTQTSCVSASNTYTQQVTVTYAGAPASGTLDVNGQSFAITSSPQTVTLTGLNADGAAVNVTANFSADTGCTRTTNNLFTAPAYCGCPTNPGTISK